MIKKTLSLRTIMAVVVIFAMQAIQGSNTKQKTSISQLQQLLTSHQAAINTFDKASNAFIQAKKNNTVTDNIEKTLRETQTSLIDSARTITHKITEIDTQIKTPKLHNQTIKNLQNESHTLMTKGLLASDQALSTHRTNMEHVYFPHFK